MTPAVKQRLGLVGLTVAVTLAGGLVLGYRIELLASSPASFFLWTGGFLRQWLGFPGGPLLYAGAFLHQFYHYMWAGALAGGAVAAGCGGCLSLARRRLSGREDLLHALAPGAMLVILQALSTLTLGYTLAGAALAAHACLPTGRWRRGFAVASVPVLYLLAGAHVWFYVLWVAVFDWRERAPGRARFALGLIGLAAVTPLVAWRFLFAVSLRAAWLAPLRAPQSPGEWVVLVYLLLAPLLPPLAAVVGLRRGLSAGRVALAEVGLLAGIALGLTAAVFQPDLRRLAEYQRHYEAQDWAGVVALAEEDARDRGNWRGPQDASQAVRQCIANHALARQGRLLESMFRQPQPWGTWGLVLNLPSSADLARWAMYNSDLFLALGHTHAAYRWAYNQSTLLGPTYANTRQLAQCALVDGNEAIAAKYAAVLERTLFHRSEGAAVRRQLADREGTGRRLASLRGFRPRLEVDVALGELGALLALVESEPDNRLAVDYLVAWCLLDKQALPLAVDQIARHLNRHYARMPLHCQEALLLWAAPEPGAAAEVDRLCSPAVLQQFAGVADVLAAVGRGSADQRAAARIPGGTNWSYFASQQAPPAAFPGHAWRRLAAEFDAVGASGLAALLVEQARLREEGR